MAKKPKDKFKSEKAPKLSKQNRSNFSKFKTKVRSLAKKGVTKTKDVAKKVATKAKQSKTLQKVGTNLKQRLAISRTLSGNPYSPATTKGLNIPPSSVQDLATRSAQRGTQISKNLLSTRSIKGGLASTLLINAGNRFIAEPVGGFLGRNLGRALVPAARKLDDFLPGINSKDEKRRREEAEAEKAVAKANIQTPAPVVPPNNLKPDTPVPDTGGSSEPITPPIPVKKPVTTKQAAPTKKTFKDIWGKNPTSIQKKLMDGGWTAQELYQKKLAHEQWKKNRRRK